LIDLLIRECISASLFFLRLVPSNTLMGRIIRDPKVMGGKPVVKGTRVTVEVILRRLASGLSVEDLLRNLSYTFQPILWTGPREGVGKGAGIAV